MKYKVLKTNRFVNFGYSIIPIRERDMESIRRWRNAQMDILRQKSKLTNADQKKYFNKIVKTLFQEENPKQLLFSFLKNSKLIGYGGLVNISWPDKRAEMSFLVDNKRVIDNNQYKKDMNNFIKLIKQVCFKELKLNRLFTETYAFREFHISILQDAGFKEEGRMRQHILVNGRFYDSILHSILKSEYYEEY